MTLVQKFKEISNTIIDLRVSADWKCVKSDFGVFEHITITDWHIPTGDKLGGFFCKVARLENLLDKYADYTDLDEEYSHHYFLCGEDIAFVISIAPIWL